MRDFDWVNLWMCQPVIDDTHFAFFSQGYETSLSEGLHFEKKLFHSTFSTVSGDWLVSAVEKPLATTCLVCYKENTAFRSQIINYHNSIGRGTPRHRRGHGLESIANIMSVISLFSFFHRMIVKKEWPLSSRNAKLNLPTINAVSLHSCTRRSLGEHCAWCCIGDLGRTD